MQNFESPTFREEDNPIAFADNQLTRVLSQNYLYLVNFWLLINPEWLSFDWSFGSIELIETFQDYRFFFVMIFYFMMIALVFKGFKRR